VRLGGLPKGLVLRDGEPIMARSLRLFGDLFADRLIVANAPAPYTSLEARVVPDALPGKGAPGGLHAALLAARTQWIFAAACDMPFLDEEPIAWLSRQRVGYRAVAVVWQGRLEPLHAFYSRDCLPVFERLLRQGEPSLWALASAVGARFVAEAEWRKVDPEGHSFANVNTAEDALRLGLALPSPEKDALP
jgi:molybdenum cofactor guanylyltransferase